MAKSENIVREFEQQTARADDRVVELPQPTPDQVEFLEQVGLRYGEYDATVVVGGPSRFLNRTA